MTEQLKAIKNEPGSDDERDALKHCRTLIEAESEASKDIKEAQAHLDQNVIARYAAVTRASILGPLGWPLFRRRTARSAARHPIWRKRGTRKSGLETNAENEARSALLARLW